MLNDSIDLKSSINKVNNEKLFPLLTKIIDDSILLIHTAFGKRSDFLNTLLHSSEDNLSNFLKINYDQLELIKNNNAFRRVDRCDVFLKEYSDESLNLIKALPKEVIQEQKKERFITLKDDKFAIKFLKFFKSKIFFFSRIPFYLKNFIKKIFGKEKKQLKYWKQRIPYQSISKFHLFEDFLLDSISINSKVFSEVNKNIVDFWRVDQEFDFNFFESDGNFSKDQIKSYNEKVAEIISNLNNLKDSMADEFNLLYKKHTDEFDDTLNKVDTIELLRRNYSEKKLSNTEKNRIKSYDSLLKNWKATTQLLQEDWLQDIELLILKGELIKESNQVISFMGDYTGNKIKNLIIELGEEINRVSEEIKNTSDIINSIGPIRNKLIEKFENRFNPQFDEMIVAENIAVMLDGFETHFNELLNNIADKRMVSNSDDYSKEISAGTLTDLSPREIIKLEVLPKFSASIKNLKSNLFSKFNEYRTALFDIQQIADFTLEASADFDQSVEIKTDSPDKVIERGIQRAYNRNKTLVEDLISFSDSLRKNYDTAFSQLLDDLMQLTINENIIKLKLIIVKAKALKTATGFGVRFTNKFNKLVNSLVGFAKDSFNKAKLKLSVLSKKFGIAERPEYLASEASDFLAETNKALEKLPYIYKRLFRVEPLRDERLFAAREFEYAELIKAYKNWLKGRFSPVIFVGEKGSGVSTILNLALKSVRNKEIYRTDVKRIIYREIEFLSFLSELFEAEKFQSKNDVIDFLNNTENKRIIIIENIQHLYLRTVGGFEPLKFLFSVISATNKNAFWITSTTIYSWDFLKKTISISEYFAYLIKLKNLTNQQIIELIDKRHKISGFDLQFELSEEIKKNKSLAEKSDEEINEILKKEFYNKLNKFAGSNISLALLYWIRAAKDFKGNTLIMNPELEIDVSFLSSIKDEKLFILHSLVLHDGIDINNLAITTGYDKETCKLIVMQLMDDGILLSRDENYIVNPLVYRQLTTILKNKNILH